MPFRKALLLAAGRGSRLGAATDQVPKPMLRVRGKPVLERHVEQLAAAGVAEIWINLHHQGRLIRDYFGSGDRWGLRIRYSEEPSLLGTAGALKNLETEFAADDFFVVYGDNVAHCDYRALAAAHRPGTLLTVALYHNDDVSTSGIADLAADGRILRFLEKPAPGQEFSHWVNTGLYAASPALLPLLPPGVSDFARDVIPALLAAGRPVRGFVLPTAVAGIDTPELLARADVLGVAVIGAGRMGARRASVAAAAPGCRLIWVIDQDANRAQHVAAPLSARSAAGPGPAPGDPGVGPAHLAAEPHAARSGAGAAAASEDPGVGHAPLAAEPHVARSGAGAAAASEDPGVGRAHLADEPHAARSGAGAAAPSEDPGVGHAHLADEPHAARSSTDARAALEDPRVDCVVVSTSNDQLAPLARAALEAGKHVLVEKPAARSAAEIEPIVALAAGRRLVCKAGFNYRFHPAVRRAHEMLRSGAIGRLLHIIARHGHGGRLGLEREWRARPEIAGGGELLDQGVHLIDLFRWFSGEPVATAQAVVATEFWPIQPLEDAAFCLLRSPSGVTASLTVSLLEWKNRFQFDLVGERGVLAIEGLGGSYGPETLTVTRRPEQFGAPQIERIEFENPEQCWADEWADFTSAIREGRAPLGDARDSLAALRAVEACYRSARESRAVEC